MKTLYTFRHAKSSWKDPGLGDFERPLNKRGKRASKAMAKFMAKSDIKPDLILCSAAARATETLDYLLKRLPKTSTVLIEEGLYLASNDELLARLNEVENAVKSVMIIGHNPGLADLALLLSGDGSDDQALDDIQDKYPTGALAILNGPGKWSEFSEKSCQLRDFIRPRSLEDKPKLTLAAQS